MHIRTSLTHAGHSAYKATHASTTDALLAERDHIDGSHRMTDQLLEQAYETRGEFGRQRSAISGINTRMHGVLGMFSSPCSPSLLPA